MKKYWYWVIGIYLLGVIVAFYSFSTMYAPGPSLGRAILMSLLWPITLIGNLFF